MCAGDGTVFRRVAVHVQAKSFSRSHGFILDGKRIDRNGMDEGGWTGKKRKETDRMGNERKGTKQRCSLFLARPYKYKCIVKVD